ncbi:uncharacterized protein [Littorina saxatilis]
MEFRYMWHQIDSPASDTDTDQPNLGAGYRNVLVDTRSPFSKAPASGTGDSQNVVIEEWHLRYVQELKIQTHNKWIVLDVTSTDCRGSVSTPSGWKTLVIGHAGRQTGCKLPSCVTLEPDSNRTVFRHEGAAWWKNLAYLAALSHGAQLILDADCSVSLAEAVTVLKFSPAEKDHGMMYNETLLFNPYAHFGAWAAAPRAASGSSGGRLNNSHLYFIRDFDHNVVVKHALSEASQDIVTDKRGGAPITRFDRSAPPVFVGQRSFSAAIPACSVYSRDAVWGLVLPCVSHSVRCHALRLLLAQRLFREMDAFSGYYQLHATSSVGPFPESEAGQAVDAQGLVLFLDAWKCASNLTFFGCIDALVEDMFKNGSFINQHEKSLLKSWIIALQKTAGVVEPARRSSPWRGVRKVSEMRMTFGSVLSQLESGGSKVEQRLRSQCADQVKRSCNGSVGGVNWFPTAQWRKPLIMEVVLIVVFNSNRFFWNNLPFLETMHRPFFKHIVYCVPNVDELVASNRNEDFPYLTMVEGLSDQWYLMYECLTTAARINFQGVRGFLQIGDDTLLNTWLLFNMPRDSMWMPHGFTTMRGDQSSHRWDWYWWKKSRGRPAVLHALADLERISGMTSEQLRRLDPNFNKTSQSPKHRAATTFLELYKNGKEGFPPNKSALRGAEVWDEPSKQEALGFLNNYYRANRLAGLLTHRAMDLFYIPQVLIDRFVSFSRYFMRHGVIIELAVPTIHFGLSHRSDVKYVTGKSLWEHDRSVTYSFYNNATFFLHPFKMKATMGEKQGQNLFCQVYMKNLFLELFKHVKR